VVRWAVIHLPHIVPPLIAFAFLARLAVWAAAQPPSHFTDEEVEAWNRERALERERLGRPVRRATSILGLSALGPIVIAFGTGLWIYTLSLRGEGSSEAMIWTHVITGAVGLLFVSIKAMELGWRRILRRLEARRPQDAIASLIMLVLGVPLLLTGIAMLVAPSGGSFTTVDYIHIIASVWWVVLVQWHLFRYFRRALRAATGERSEPASSPG
jgi:hypothetical protein